jgi:DnaK suppressor protein
MAINIDVMKQRLEAKRRELLMSLGELTEAQPQPIDPVQASEGTEDVEEAAVDINEMEDERAVRANERQLLQEVEAALERIRLGTYGYCTICGRPIEEKRLEAMPWAARDIAHEEQLEERQSAGD